MSNKKLTHKGLILGVDARTPKDYKQFVMLRETKNFWVTKGHIKFRKSDGCIAGEKYSTYELQLNSIEPINVLRGDSQ